MCNKCYGQNQTDLTETTRALADHYGPRLGLSFLLSCSWQLPAHHRIKTAGSGGAGRAGHSTRKSLWSLAWPKRGRGHCPSGPCLGDSLHPGECLENVLLQPSPAVLDEVVRPIRILLGHPAQPASARTVREGFTYPGAVRRHGLQLANPVGRHDARLLRIREYRPCEGVRALGLRDHARHCPFEPVARTIAAREAGARARF